MVTNARIDTETVLTVDNLRTHFTTRWGTVKAVDGISFDLRKGETLGIVGESGCGKSVTMLSLMRLIPEPPGRIVSGSITLDGEDLVQISEQEMAEIRGSKIALIIQDPMTSLNPVFSIGNQVEEAIKIHQDIPKRSIMEGALEVLRKVNIPAAESRVKDFPHQMSGGMRQRVVGAIGISCQPQVLIADEPTTSLDVTIQAQYLKLLKDIQRDSDLSHPYTEALLASVPKMDRDVDRLFSIEGQPPPLHDLPVGCAFADRCPVVMDKCREQYPDSVTVSDSHIASCWRATE